MYNVISSDHRPLSFVLNSQCRLDPEGVFKSKKLIVHDWNKIDLSTVNFYSNVLNDRLDRIVVPLNLRNCCYNRCNDHSHFVDLDRYYKDVLQCIKHSVDTSIHVRSSYDNQFNVPGWNHFVQEKYDVSREAFLDWVYCSRPRFGSVFIRMSCSRAVFKLALRYCRMHEDQLRADACAKSLTLGQRTKYCNADRGGGKVTTP